MKRLSKFIFLLIFILQSLFLPAQDNETIPATNKYLSEVYQNAINISKSQPDSAVYLLTMCKETYTVVDDSTNVVKCLIALSDVQVILGNYDLAYDYLWEGLLVTESLQDSVLLSKLYQNLGTLYGIYMKEEEALFHMQTALKLNKQLMQAKKISRQDLRSSYFSIALLYRRSGKFDQALTYLDSCEQIPTGMHNGYVNAERAYVMMMKGELEKANHLLLGTVEAFENENRNYLVIVYSYLGELRKKQNRLGEAIAYFQQSLQVMEESNVHSDFRPDVLEHLSYLYAVRGDYRSAYLSLKDSKDITDSLFSARSSNNHMFEIRNRYSETISVKDKQIKQQEQLLTEKSAANFRLKVFIAIVTLLITIVTLVVYNRYQKKKFNHEKRDNQLKRESEKAQTAALIEVKNKELTAYTLQLIDKERRVNELMDYIRKLAPHDSKVKNLEKTISVNNQQMWDEFNVRFTTVNEGFYERLREKHPALSDNDLKYCALIKLNFSGKEMARLLNISLSSVHISRYRLRKKLGLEKDEKLSYFMARV